MGGFGQLLCVRGLFGVKYLPIDKDINKGKYAQYPNQFEKVFGMPFEDFDIDELAEKYQFTIWQILGVKKA